MKKIKLISICTALIIVFSGFFTFKSINTVNAATTTQATVTYGEITENGVEVTVKFSKDISENTFSGKWSKEDSNTIKATFAEGACAYVYVKSSDGSIEEGKIAIPIKLQEKEKLNMVSTDTGLTISNMQSADTTIATVSGNTVTAVKEGKTTITADVKVSGDDVSKVYNWDLTVVKNSSTTEDNTKQDEENKQDDTKKDGENKQDDTKKDEENKQDDTKKDEENKQDDKKQDDTKKDEENKQDAPDSTNGIWANLSNATYTLNVVDDNHATVKINGISDIKGALVVYFSSKEETEEEVLNNYKKYFDKSEDFEWCLVDDTNTTSLSSKAYELLKGNSDIYMHIVQIAEAEDKDSLSALDHDNVKVIVPSVKIDKTEKETDIKVENEKKTDGKDETTAEGKLPQTGMDNTVLFTIYVVAIVTVVGFVGYRKYKNIK